MSVTIHPSAVVDPAAQLGTSCVIGPFCVVGPQVVLGDGVVLKSHVVVAGDTQIGAGSVIFPFAVVGEVPQDLKFAGENTRLRIGAGNRIREHVTINVGTAGGGGETRIGSGGLFMAGCHVAHDCKIGDQVILVNSVAIAGHCMIGDDVIVGGLSGVHQWVRIGKGAIIGAVCMVTNDVIPYGLVHGTRGELHGLNLVGLKRRGMDRADINALRAAFEALKSGDGSFQDRARAMVDHNSAAVRDMVAFVLADSDRQFLTPV
jgi:UDP-N-acetylglucosamine acyltransferase